MAPKSKRQGEREEDQLQDTLIASFAVGVIITAIWLAVFFVYMSRL